MNMQKIKIYAVYNMLDHYGRGDSDRQKERSNKNIDPERSPLNYNLAAEIQPMPACDFYKKRLSEISVHGNAKVGIVSWIITVPKTLPENEYKAFFKAAFDFFTQMHGKENVVSAYVHMDETTPHMHYCFVPVVLDKEKGEKLCAKNITTRSYLNKAHPEAEKYISDALGHHVEILNEATKEGNKSLEEFKRGKAKEDLAKAKIEADKIVSDAITTAETIVKDYEIVSAAYENKKEYVNAVENSFEKNEEVYGVEEHKPTQEDPNYYFKVPANIWYRQKISKDMLEIHANSQNKAMQIVDKLADYEKTKKALIRENITLEEKLAEKTEEVDYLNKWIEKFKKALRKLAERIPGFRKIYDEVAKEVDEEEIAEKDIQRTDRNDLNNDIEL